MTVELSIVIPAYNEQDRIRPTLEEYASVFREPGPASEARSFELLVVLNGCRDNTRAVVEDIAADVSELRIVEFPEPLGKGGAIHKGLDLASGSLLAYVDADNMVRADETVRLVDALRDYYIVVADRFRGTQTNGAQPLLRRIISLGSRMWVRRYLHLPYSDTQCGAKAIRADAWRAIAPNIQEQGWAFDLDVLAHALRLGFSVAEIPVNWQHIAQGSKVQPWRDVPATFLSTVRIKRRVRRAS